MVSELALNHCPTEIILHLKNPLKSVTVGLDDEDRDPAAPLSEYNTAKLMTNIEVRVLAPSHDRSYAAWLLNLILISSYSGSNLPNESAKESSDDKKTLPTAINVILVNFSSVPKDTIPMKHKAFDVNQPPHSPHAFQEISQNSSITSYEAFMASLVAVKCMEDSCGGLDGEKIMWANTM
ncbi:hypothetical protein EDC04DRAFT_2612164 [Pisolithus marmoratus]|nr:hypothetical protein EDC04DRAFT_2612164 [Pisolithus marmoratus]